MNEDLFPYLVKVRFPEVSVPFNSHPVRECTLVILSEIKPDYTGGGKPKDHHAFCMEAKKLISEDAQVLEADMMVWAANYRAVYLDDSAEKIKEYLA